MTDDAIKDSPEQTEYRTYCRKWLAENPIIAPKFRLPQSALEIMTIEQMDYLKTWQKRAYHGGLIGCDYAKKYGGQDRVNCQCIANEEMQKIRVPFFPNKVGLEMAAPTIFFHAKEDVKKELLQPTFSGDIIWCQGFSEPAAGSDLAGLQTFAQKKGDRWLINGHKVWTSFAHFADWMILLARTDKTDKHGGLSYFVVPIKKNLEKSVSVQPLIKMTGETGFNEVRFENLEIDDKYRLDSVGKGWAVAQTTLLHERGAGQLVSPKSESFGSSSNDSESGLISNLINLAKSSYSNGELSSNNPLIRDKLMDILIRYEGHEQNQRRNRIPALCDHPLRIPLQWKLVTSEIDQDMGNLSMQMEGAASSLYIADPHSPSEGQSPLAYMNSFGMTIAAGTSEIQRNILGEKILGLPKSK